MTPEQKSLCDRFEALFGNNPCIAVDVVEVGDATYFVTSGTGEGSFAYHEVDFENGLGVAEMHDEEVYTVFCDHANAVCDEPAIAEAVYAALSIRISNPGSCDPMTF